MTRSFAIFTLRARPRSPAGSCGVSGVARASPTRSAVAGGRELLLLAPVALPGQAGPSGAVPDAVDPRPGLAAGLRAGEGRAAGRRVHQDVAEQQAVEAAERKHGAAGETRGGEASEGREDGFRK